MMTPRIWTDTDVFDDPAFPLAIREAHTRDSRHRHTFRELVIVRDGNAIHRMGRKSYPIAAGDVFLINTDQSHGFTEAAGLVLCNILFHDRVLEGAETWLDRMPEYQALFRLEPKLRQRQHFAGRLRLAPAQVVDAFALAAAARDEIRRGAPGCEAAAVAIFVQLVVQLCRWYRTGGTPEAEELIGAGRAISHIHNHFAEPIKIEDLAAIAHMSRRNFFRQFRHATGLSPLEYLIRVRLAQGRRDLQHSRRRISEIAFAVGFSDSNYFTRQFRQHYGESPRSYRRRT